MTEDSIKNYLRKKKQMFRKIQLADALGEKTKKKKLLKIFNNTTRHHEENKFYNPESYDWELVD